MVGRIIVAKYISSADWAYYYADGKADGKRGSYNPPSTVSGTDAEYEKKAAYDDGYKLGKEEDRRERIEGRVREDRERTDKADREYKERTDKANREYRERTAQAELERKERERRK